MLSLTCNLIQLIKLPIYVVGHSFTRVSIQERSFTCADRTERLHAFKFSARFGAQLTIIIDTHIPRVRTILVTLIAPLG